MSIDENIRNLYGEIVPRPTHIVHSLRHWAGKQPHDVAFYYTRDGEDEQRITFSELDRQARSIAARLQELDLVGERALLLFPPGLDFVRALFGCFYAGVVAVPAYPPRKNRHAERISLIADNCSAAAVITVPETAEELFGAAATTKPLRQMKCLTTDDLMDAVSDRWEMPPAERQALALLQYTSGSTGEPKGVMLTHGNLMHNCAMIVHAFQPSRTGIGMTWLPVYHDMGLIGNVLKPVYIGRPNVLMSPIEFLQQPIRWLRAISHYRATISGGPSFAYALCNERISDAQCEGLDLSCWDVAYNGAEPVRADTIERFTEKFAPFGFRARTFFPCYGLAESTLIVTGGKKDHAPVIRGFDKSALLDRRVEPNEAAGATRLVGCGRALPDEQVLIVDPQRRVDVDEGQVGEVWVRGPSVGRGYWNDAAQTDATFGGRLANGDGPFLRTGDLGFLWEGELFVTGRLKDLIIVRGCNHHPHDIERTVEACHEALRDCRGAAFSMDSDAEEKLVVVHEVRRDWLRRFPCGEVVSQIRKAITEQHELGLDAVAFVKPGTLPVTSSGKVRRRACREAFRDETLKLVADWRSPVKNGRGQAASYRAAADETNGRVTEQQVLQWTIDWVAAKLNVMSNEISPRAEFTGLGLDSLMVVEFTRELEQWIGRPVDATLLWNFPTIESLAHQIATGDATAGESPPVVPELDIATSGVNRAAAGFDAPCACATRVRQANNDGPSALPAGPTRNGKMPRTMDFSLFFFSSDEAVTPEAKYRTVLEAAKFADRHEFTSVWVPERHFHAFGGIYPNPSVVAAALAMVTDHVRIRAGSVVLPLHKPLRVAEEWSVVDNLSGGRVDVAVARGWNPNDFVLAPENYESRKEELISGIEQLRGLWQGDSATLPNGKGTDVQVRMHPRPVQESLPVWMTCTGGAEMFELAGRMGTDVLTALLFQSTDELAKNINLYRSALAEHGHDSQAGRVTLMLHTYVDESTARVHEKVKAPFTEYLRTSVDLWRHGTQRGSDISEAERKKLLDYAYERYFRTSALFGTTDDCLETIKRLYKLGVNEIACLIDFGVDDSSVLASLVHLDKLRRRARTECGCMSLPNTSNKGHFASAPIDPRQAEQILNCLDALPDADVDRILRSFIDAKRAGSV